MDLHRHLRAVVLVACLALRISAIEYASIHDVPCPTGWNHDRNDDTCNAIFPRQNHNFTVGGKVNFYEAAHFCAGEGAEMPLIYSTAKLAYYNGLAGPTSGRTWWIGVRNDPSHRSLPQRWITRQRRTEGFLFEWDGKQQPQPGPQGCVVQHMRGDKKKTVGGRTKMVTRDCYERHSVICTKPRVPPHISAVNQQPPGRIEAVWRHPNTYTFWGQNIPYGTRLSLQTTTEEEFVEAPNQPTRCKHVGVVHGASEPIELNVTKTAFYNKLCNGTCQSATVTFPSTWPFVRGAKYSLCFFVPRPWATPQVPTEYDYELLGGDAFVEVVQKHEEYLRDVCLRRRHNLEMFYGSGHVDTHRDLAHPWYFESAVEQGRG